MNVFGFFVLIFYQKNGGAGGAVSPTKHKFLWRNKMEEWIDREIDAIIEGEFDERTMNSRTE